jgi:FtsP/CotA-like multicopper oxidase with cupredoxin domain
LSDGDPTSTDDGQAERALPGRESEDSWPTMNRRRFVGGAAAALAACDFLAADAAHSLPAAPKLPPQVLCGAGLRPTLAADVAAGAADFHLSIEDGAFEIAPGKSIRTKTFGGQAIGPQIRTPEGRPISIRVDNKTADADIVHWHGLRIPAAVDGAMEEGSPMIPPGGSVTYNFTPEPAGTRWYHTHAMAGRDLGKGLYTAEYGFFIIDPKSDPGRYDQEVFVALHHWEPAWVSLQDFMKGPPADNGLEIRFGSASINGRALGHGDPIRVWRGQRVLFRLLNSGAEQDVMLALPGHSFRVVAMDGNPTPSQQTVDWLMMSPGERIDAVVEMNEPGVWVLGSMDDRERESGLGVVVEYADAVGDPVWLRQPMPRFWDYSPFANSAPAPAPDENIELVFQKIAGGRGGYNRWTINGKSWPTTDRIKVTQGKRYRISMHNLSGDMHPIHIHRHTFEVTNYMGKQMSGLMKDVVMLPGRRSGEIDFVADNPGLSLFHCHMQDHQDFGFMSLIEYV